VKSLHRYAPGGSNAKRDFSALELGALHKQVMPFILRRTKDEVLRDLPPKILQDVMVELSPLQRRLYDLVQSPESGLSDAVSAGDSKPEQASRHIFSALQYVDFRI
jgi:TATA-binding protein-associated factor